MHLLWCLDDPAWDQNYDLELRELQELEQGQVPVVDGQQATASDFGPVVYSHPSIGHSIVVGSVAIVMDDFSLLYEYDEKHLSSMSNDIHSCFYVSVISKVIYNYRINKVYDRGYLV